MKLKCKTHCIYCLLESKLLVRVINYFIAYKKTQGFQDISGEETSSKVPTNTPCVFHAKTRCFSRSPHIVSNWNIHSVFIGLKQ